MGDKNNNKKFIALHCVILEKEKEEEEEEEEKQRERCNYVKLRQWITGLKDNKEGGGGGGWEGGGEGGGGWEGGGEGGGVVTYGNDW